MMSLRLRCTTVISNSKTAGERQIYGYLLIFFRAKEDIERRPMPNPFDITRNKFQ